MSLTGADRLAIADVGARYNYAIDFGDVAGWVATFTEDGAFENPSGRYEGPEGLKGFAVDFIAQFPDGRHWIHNLVVDGDGDEASAACYLHMFRAGSNELVATGRYDDKLRRVDGKWLFVERVVTVDG